MTPATKNLYTNPLAVTEVFYQFFFSTKNRNGDLDSVFSTLDFERKWSMYKFAGTRAVPGTNPKFPFAINFTQIRIRVIESKYFCPS